MKSGRFYGDIFEKTLIFSIVYAILTLLTVVEFILCAFVANRSAFPLYRKGDVRDAEMGRTVEEEKS